MFRRFCKSRDGNVAMTFGLISLPLVALSGSALDMDYMASERARAQSALDRATLAAAADLGASPTTTIETRLKALYAEFYTPPAGVTATVPTVTFQTDKGEVSAAASVTVPANFVKLIGISDLTAGLSSTAAIGVADYDVALVLDNSGSMAGTKIATLQTAAKDLVSTLLGINAVGTRADRVQIGVVPFAASVNVGAGYGPTYSGTTRTGAGTGAAWLDVSTLSPIHKENWNSGLTDNRFDLFARLAAAYSTYASVLKWGGCVETRPYPYDVADTAPTTSTPATLFVPMFAPDEPGYRVNGTWTNPSGFYNNYLDDNGGACTANSTSTSTAAGQKDAQGRTCKYKAPTSSQFRNASSLGSGFGPNYSCTSKPILPLTRDETAIDAHIDSLVANGNTNIHEGVMWGWRVLSAGLPFTEGRTGTTEKPLRKFMIVMTDGDNTYTSSTNINASSYAAYGYIAKNRLGTTSTSSTTVKSYQDTRTAEACTNAKTDGGLIVYTIGFQVSSTATLNLLKACATQPSYFYDAQDNAALLAAFKQIAKEITQLRIAR